MKRVVHVCLDTLVPHERNDFRPYLLRSVGTLLALLLIVAALLGVAIYRTQLAQSDYLASVLPSVLADLANVDRESNALPTLTVNPLLVAAAQLKANDMAAKGYFSHVSPDGSSPWRWFKEAGYAFVYAGENLAINFDDSAAVNDAWMRSPTHRANILGSHYTEVGLATAQGMYEGKMTTFIVQEFGSPALTSSQATVAPLSTATSTPVEAAPAPTSAPTVLATVTVPAAKEPQVVPVVEQTVSPVETPVAASGASSFVAVKDETATPLPQATGTEQKVAPVSSLSNRVLSSPSLLLEIFYGFIGLLLVIGILAVSLVPHEHQKRHVLRLAALSFALIALYLIAGYYTFSSLVIR